MKPAFSVCRTSDVYIGPAARLLPDLLPEGRVIAVTDDEVYRCHGELLAPFETVRIGRGERCKTLSTVEELCRRLIAAGADRKTFILGVGGGIVTDVAGYFLRPNGGFFPGFALNEFLLGFLYGCWLYKKPVSLWRTFCACLSAVLVINLVLTPLWLNIMYGNAFVISGMRLIKNAVKLPLDTALLYFLLKAVETHRKKAL